MLADRFTLAAHTEPAEVQGYAVVVSKRGTKLKKADMRLSPLLRQSKNRREDDLPVTRSEPKNSFVPPSSGPSPYQFFSQQVTQDLPAAPQVCRLHCTVVVINCSVSESELVRYKVASSEPTVISRGKSPVGMV